MVDGVVEPMLQSGQLAEHGVAAHVQPRIVDVGEPVLDLLAGVDGALLVAGGDRGSGGEQRVGGLVPGRPNSLRSARAAGGELHRLLELAVVGHDVGEVVAAAGAQVVVVDDRGEVVGGGDVMAGSFEVSGRRLEPGGEQQGRGPVDRRGGCRRRRRARS